MTIIAIIIGALLALVALIAVLFGLAWGGAWAFIYLIMAMNFITGDHEANREIREAGK